MNAHPFLLVSALSLSFATSMAVAQESMDLIAPLSKTIIDEAGNTYPFAPVRIYSEAHFGAARSSAGLVDSVDYQGQRKIAGAEFV